LLGRSCWYPSPTEVEGGLLAGLRRPDSVGSAETRAAQPSRNAVAQAASISPTPVLIVVGDSDGTTPEHAVEMFRLRGGGVFGDIAGLPTAQLAILPGTTHVGILERADLLVPIVNRFLEAPVPGAT